MRRVQCSINIYVEYIENFFTYIDGKHAVRKEERIISREI